VSYVDLHLPYFLLASALPTGKEYIVYLFIYFNIFYSWYFTAESKTNKLQMLSSVEPWPAGPVSLETANHKV
jgi:hypothetical protein